MGSATEVTGVETFTWMEGGFFLTHHWESSFEVAGSQVLDTGYEFFDYDPETGQYRTHFSTASARTTPSAATTPASCATERWWSSAPPALAAG